jgi:hypothetical protein
MVTLQNVYDAFLGKVNEDDWTYAYDEKDIEWFVQDWRSFLSMAIAYFKFPNCSLDINEETGIFTDSKMGYQEV